MTGACLSSKEEERVVLYCISFYVRYYTRIGLLVANVANTRGGCTSL